MIVQSLCNKCYQPYTILLDPSDLPLIKQLASDDGRFVSCPRLCGGQINITMDHDVATMSKDRRLREPMNITGKQLYKAVNGAGLPDEISCSAVTILALLQANKVGSVAFESVGQDLYIHEIRLGDGVVIHLTAGQRGAKVLKITKER